MITVVAVSRWSSEGDNSEIEYKDGLQEHCSAQGRSDWSRCIEESEMMILVERKVAVLYSGCLGFIRTAFSKRMIKRPRCPLH